MVCDDAGMAKKIVKPFPSTRRDGSLEDYFSQFSQTSIDLDRAILFIEHPIPGSPAGHISLGLLGCFVTAMQDAERP